MSVTGRDNATTAVVQVSKDGALTKTVAWGRESQGEGSFGLANGWEVRKDGGGDTGSWGARLGCGWWRWDPLLSPQALEGKPRGSFGPLESLRVEVFWEQRL